jgi:predicted dehydrogenase
MGHGHAMAYRLASDKCRLAWVADLDAERAQRTADAAGGEPISDWTARLDEVDAVSICTPHHLHKPMAIEAMRAGKHVLVEKPLANTEADCLEMQRVAREHDVRLMCALVVRYRPAPVWLKQALDEQRWGPIHQISAWTQAFLEKPGAWFGKLDQLGGGVLFSHGCHYLDIIRWFMGADPETATMVGSNLGAEWMEGEGTAFCVMKFPGDRIAAYEASWAMRNSILNGMHVHCRDAIVVTDYDKVEVVRGRGSSAEREVVFRSREPGVPARPGESVLGEIEHFLDCIAEHREPLTDVDDALKTLRLIWRMYEGAGYGLRPKA